LTRTEFDLLRLLLRNPGRAFSDSYLLDTIWGVDYVTGDGRWTMPSYGCGKARPARGRDRDGVECGLPAAVRVAGVTMKQTRFLLGAGPIRALDEAWLIGLVVALGLSRLVGRVTPFALDNGMVMLCGPERHDGQWCGRGCRGEAVSAK